MTTMKLSRYVKRAALALALVLPLVAADESSSSRPDDAILKEILNELREIHKLLEKQPQPAPKQQADKVTRAVVGVDGAFSIGPKDAPVTIVEFTDFQCPYCQRFHTTAFRELQKNYIDAGKVRFVSRDLPLDIHPNALQAAQAGRCAGEHGQFWPMRDRMQTNPDKLDIDHLVSFAKDLSLDEAQFRACVESGKYTEAIKNDVLAARKIGANGTPSFVIGRDAPEGVDGELVVGAMPYQMLDQKLRALLQ
jgi:protein-disulfide isomerase